MKPRTLLVLFLLVAGLGAFVWFYERDLPGTDERAERAKQLLPDLDSGDVTALELTSEKGTVSLERSPKDDSDAASDTASWQLVEPLEARADQAAIDGLLSTLASLEKKRTLDDLDADEAGLAAPRARVTIHEGEREIRLAFGGSVPASDDVLAAVGDGPPYFVTAGAVLSELDKEPGEWRDRDLFPGTRAEVDRLRVTTSAGTTLLARRGEDFWVEEPYADRADETAVSKLLTAITGLRAESFVDGPADGSGLDAPAVDVEVVLSGREEPVRIALGGGIEGETRKRWTRVDGQVAQTQDQLWGATAGDPERWRSPDWTSLDAFEVDHVEVTEPGHEPVVLERREGEWTRDGETIPFATASDLIYAITGARATKVEEGAMVGEATLDLTLEAADRAQTLHLFAARDGRRPATVDERSVVLWLDEDVASDIDAKWSAVRDAETTESDSSGDAGDETNSAS